MFARSDGVVGRYQVQRYFGLRFLHCFLFGFAFFNPAHSCDLNYSAVLQSTYAAKLEERESRNYFFFFF